MNYYPLHEACKGNDVDQVQPLIEVDCMSPIENDQYGNTPLHYASTGNIQVVEYLLLYNDVLSNIDSVNNNGETAFHVTAMSGEVDVAELLLGRGANPTIRNKGGYMPLHYAHMYCNQQNFEGTTILKFYEACQNLWNHGEWFPKDNIDQDIDQLCRGMARL